eukprot:COSAG03_NODE_3807_length_1821_cov_2.594657_3_plen_62_part_00
MHGVIQGDQDIHVDCAPAERDTHREAERETQRERQREIHRERQGETHSERMLADAPVGPSH